MGSAAAVAVAPKARRELAAKRPTKATAGLDAHMLDAGWCGMAGPFGFDKAHYKVSLDIGERVWLPAVRAASADTAIIANGFSCREQIRHATGRRARHFAELVWMGMEPPPPLS